ncbi:transcription antitermination factor NusB [Paenibacillus flagellatus]|uniref:Transcription antitermination protein NusB n=1 Tax=Paenibacillus flagellatus TaxID=2211139 RepID=A0A2V5K6P1_9BACL|nr:transcription antitermination factor NusB [Paenibacillus flagellatus]PYI55051.1 transcription antitermination factor NusB [Paenibacillus flagellatus]
MKRRLAREIALQSLYTIDMNEVPPQVAIETVLHEARTDNEAELAVGDGGVASTPYLTDLVEGTYARREQIDKTLSVYLTGWKVDRLSKVDRQILRLAAYEMLFGTEVPPKVVVNEAIELAKRFGSDESGKFVNGVLGKMIKELDAIKSEYETAGENR